MDKVISRLHGRALLVLVVSLLSLALVSGVGDAPLGVFGTVLEGGVPVSASVELQAFGEGSVIAVADPVLTNDEGEFFSVLTVPDGAVVDVQLTIVAGDVFVEVVEGAAAWQTYSLVLDLSEDSLGLSAEGSSVIPPGDSSLDADLDALRESGGDAPVVIEKYGLVVEESPLPPVEERPLFVPAPPRGVVRPVSPVVLEVAAVIIIAVCFFVIRFEVLRHRR